MVNPRFALLALTASGIMLAACDDARTLEAREEGATAGTCAACHGFPPPAPHPQSQSCFVCHPQTVDANSDIIPGGAHQNGRVDPADVSFGHPANYLAEHSSDAIRDIRRCAECHGASYDGGFAQVSCNGCHGVIGFARWQSNCTFCHGTRDTAFTLDRLAEAAPPGSVAGATATTDPGVGAHQKHLGNGSVLSNGFQCQTCHPVGGSLDHLTGKAEVTFEFLPLASAGGATPAFTEGTQTCSVYCHGATLAGGTATSPRWTQALTSCDSCHGIPPASGYHATHAAKVTCAECHVGYTNTSVDKDTHVNGVRDVNEVIIGADLSHTVVADARVQGWNCAACHP
ncbi:CxxxxCH/CxxCH domain-containing protein [Anaeromyxobacter sp. SG17]|uniref:CxxxxCH/CxxCH domain c-type cytochrome n=1 Tax=Anaeromyxobacter sp. SG17 TaxID=2925405 RepID=UPI001F59819B|nr:CxxxxCH/CxxCH domain-containing protein [Anaeromyxobacter sp. SG17]